MDFFFYNFLTFFLEFDQKFSCFLLFISCVCHFFPFFSLLCHVSIFLCQKWSDYGIRRIFLFLLVLELFLCFLTFFLKLLKILTIFVFFSHFFANSELCFQRVHIVLSLKNCFFRYNILNTNCIQKTKKLSKIMTILYKIPRTHFPYLCSSFL